MRIVFVGSVIFSKECLLHLIKLDTEIVGIITKSESEFNSDFVDLSTISEEYGIPYKIVKDINHENNILWIKNLSPDIIFCFGWSSLFKREILNIAPMGVIGYHPALLPLNKGRHPIIWAKSLGLEKTGSTFFFMNEGVDSGDILSQIEVPILFEDDAFSLYLKITAVALKQIEYFLPLLQKKSYLVIPQGNDKGNIWRKRGKSDGFVDFRMSTNSICNLVRALTKPYIGAHCVYNGIEIKVWAVELGNNKDYNFEPGKIIGIENRKIEVKTGDFSIYLVEHEFTILPIIGTYLNI